MRRRLFLTAAPMAMLFGAVSLPSEARADPPSWAPAHGWRRKTGNESEFTGKKNKKDKSARTGDDDLDRETALTRREQSLARQERQDRLASRERELDRIDREARLAERERALRERRRMQQLGQR
jgi:hypothetical protein